MDKSDFTYLENKAYNDFVDLYEREPNEEEFKKFFDNWYEGYCESGSWEGL